MYHSCQQRSASHLNKPDGIQRVISHLSVFNTTSTQTAQYIFDELSWVYLAKIGNFKHEKETIANVKTPGHRRKRKVIESLPLDWWIRSIASQWTCIANHFSKKQQANAMCSYNYLLDSRKTLI